MGAITARCLAGRVRELETLRSALDSIAERPDRVVVVTGEPGIGKSALLAYLRQRAPEHGAVVRSGRASEFEVDLPHALWREVLGEALAWDSGRGDRHGLHAALREILEQAADTPLVLCLDDVHWADPASLDSLAALVRRPPAGSTLMALAFRQGQIPPTVGAALSEASREDRVTWLALEPLTEAEAAELVGDRAAAVFTQAGGNPFYLQQLARTRDAPGADALRPVDASVPAAVASALSAELSALAPTARRMLGGAAVAGDPFEVGLATAVAELSEEAGYGALDDLLAVALVKETSSPRRFAFRHPVVRRVVYETVPAAGGWARMLVLPLH